MKGFRRILILFILISISFVFADKIGPWSHFKAITSNFTVNSGDTLIINAGTEVRFNPGTIMSIFGVVLSNGTSSDPVVFAPLDPTNSEWGGITIQNTDPLQISVFNSTIFTNIYSYGDGAINIEESSVDFNNCKFLGNHADVHGGAVFVSAGIVNFSSCIFRNNNADQGGGIYIYNDPLEAASVITISDCSFLANNASQGGGIYIEDLDQPIPNMTVSVENSKFYYNKATLNGGGLYFNIASHIDLTLKYCEIKFNDAVESGGGIFTKFIGSDPFDVLPQRYLNLLVVQNSSTDGGGIFFHSGLINNPSELKFNNLTIAYNKVTASGPEKDGGGIHIVSNDNSPVINNSILWGNASTGEWNQFFIEDITGPNLNGIFPYCDIENGDWFGYEGLTVDPIFIRPPLVAENTLLSADRFDYHLAIYSLCIDAGDPFFFPIEERNPPLNMGAYGNTTQATPPPSIADIFPFVTMTDINVGDFGVTIIDFQGKSGKAIIDNINLGQGSQLLLKNSLLMDTLEVKSFTTTPQKYSKIFTDDRIVVQKVIDSVDAITKTLTITENA
ncbi:MAG: hypothetical protein GQ534_01315, partial [Candidatus Delongbacteria bacterium]|nr:hypothetical protein [Candidatus Delongbacteria bacterium]